jgi:spore photoproduct lyase
MATQKSYEEKLAEHRGKTLLDRLDQEEQEFLLARARKYRFTFQELRLVSEAALDLQMWEEPSLMSWWEQEEDINNEPGRDTKKHLLQRLEDRLQSLRSADKTYPIDGLTAPNPQKLHVIGESSNKTVVGMCPVASEDTVCCNLRTIDAVENCGFGCSYCTIQTFYDDQVVIDIGLKEKLENLELDPNRLVHLGTGQSSDALMWGNQHGLLDALCGFAARRPNVLLELKTKSKNVAYLLERDIAPNVVPSWSLNTPTIIANEEHFTASLEERLTAARSVADRGIKVAFHFHPIVHYDNWRRDYREVIEKLLGQFQPNEVAFVSFGSVTFIKPVIQAIRRRGRPTKMLQMNLVPGAKGKLSYPVPIKKEMFAATYEALAPWHDKVFMYLCMEEAELWHSTFGFAYETNEEFEEDFCRKVFEKTKA